MTDFTGLLEQIINDHDPIASRYTEEVFRVAGKSAPDALFTFLTDLPPLLPGQYEELVITNLIAIGWAAVPGLFSLTKNPTKEKQELAWKALTRFRNRLGSDALRAMLRTQPSAEFALGRNGVLGSHRYSGSGGIDSQDRVSGDLSRLKHAKTPDETLRITGLPRAVTILLGTEASLPWRRDAEGDRVWLYDWVSCDLSQFGADMVDVLLIRYRQSSGAMRSMISSSLELISDSKAVEKLLPVLHDPDVSLRSAAVRALGRIGDSRAGAGIFERLFDPEPVTRREALDALARIGGPEARDGAVRVLHDEPDHFLRWQAAKTLAQLALDDTDAVRSAAPRTPGIRIDGVRWYVSEALGSYAVPGTSDALVTALADSDDSVRYNAADALCTIGDQSSIDALVGSLQDPTVNEAVKSAVAPGSPPSHNPARGAILNAVLAEASNERSAARVQAIEALGLAEGDNVVTTLVALLCDRSRYSNSSSFDFGNFADLRDHAFDPGACIDERPWLSCSGSQRVQSKVQESQ